MVLPVLRTVVLGILGVCGTIILHSDELIQVPVCRCFTHQWHDTAAICVFAKGGPLQYGADLSEGAIFWESEPTEIFKIVIVSDPKELNVF